MAMMEIHFSLGELREMASRVISRKAGRLAARPNRCSMFVPRYLPVWVLSWLPVVIVELRLISFIIADFLDSDFARFVFEYLEDDICLPDFLSLPLP